MSTPKISAFRDLNTDHVSKDVATELFRLTEMRDEAMFRAALSMDQRAAMFSAGFAAVAGTLTAGWVSVHSGGASPSALPPLQMHVLLLSAAAYAVAATLCALATRPQRSTFPGIAPEPWAARQDLLKGDAHTLTVMRLASLQERAWRNEANQRLNGRFFLSGLLVAVAAPLVALVALLPY